MPRKKRKKKIEYDRTPWKLGHDLMGRLNLYYKGEAVAYLLKRNDNPGKGPNGDSINGFILDAVILAN